MPGAPGRHRPPPGDAERLLHFLGLVLAPPIAHAPASPAQRGRHEIHDSFARHREFPAFLFPPSTRAPHHPAGRVTAAACATRAALRAAHPAAAAARASCLLAARGVLLGAARPGPRFPAAAPLGQATPQRRGCPLVQVPTLRVAWQQDRRDRPAFCAVCGPGTWARVGRGNGQSGCAPPPGVGRSPLLKPALTKVMRHTCLLPSTQASAHSPGPAL